MCSIFQICTILADIDKQTRLGREGGELQRCAIESRKKANDAEDSIQSPPQKFAHLPDGFLICYDWLDSQLSGTVEDAGICLLS